MSTTAHLTRLAHILMHYITECIGWINKLVLRNANIWSMDGQFVLHCGEVGPIISIDSV